MTVPTPAPVPAPDRREERPLTAPLTPAMLAGRSPGPRTWLLKLHTAGVYVFLFLPIGFLVVFAFNSTRAARWTGFTAKWFGLAFGNRDIREAIGNTFLIAVVATVVAVALGTLAAYALARYRILGRAAYDALFFIPLVIPEIVQAVSLLAFVSGTVPLLGLEIGTGLPAVVFGHVSFSVSFALVVVRARLAGFDPRLEEASSDLGATPWTTFWRVTFPLALPGIVAGGLLAFTLSFDDLAITSFVTSPERQTLPLYVYSNLKNGLDPKVNVVALFMIVVSLAILAVALLFARRTARGGRMELPIAG